jgi:hypothetical protein
MTGTATSIARMVLAIMIGALLALGICGDAVAKTGKRHWHAYSHATEGRGQISAKRAQPVSQQQARLGPMRYYGGPKSPMWRGLGEPVAAENAGQLSAKSVQLVSQQPSRLGPMRYYGGPKSPMWRGPVEN